MTDNQGVDVEPGSLGGGSASSVVGAAAAGSFGDLVRSWARRVRHGESGMAPVLIGLVIIVIIFQVKTPVFLSAGNLTNLITQGAALILLGMAEVFVLLLGEIDLSIGYVGGVSSVVTVALSSSSLGPDWPWWVSILLGLAAGAVMCGIEGLLITRLGLPSFVVTLGGLLGFQGLLIYLVDRIGGSSGGTLRITNSVVFNIVNGNLDPIAGWIIMIVVVAAYVVLLFRRNFKRRASNLTAEPLALTTIKAVAITIAGVVLVLICNANRGSVIPLRGVPWVVPVIVAILVLWTLLLTRTRFGKYVYAIGGNAEAARRAGINLMRIRLAAFILGGVTAALAGLVYGSFLGSVSNNIDGGKLVLYAVAAAVIGGTSLFGGRGKMVHALVGGIIVAVINNGMGLIGLSAATQLMVTALVLLAAVVVDAVARRGRTET